MAAAFALALVLPTAHVTAPTATAAGGLQGPDWSKAWYSPVKYKSCKRGRTVHVWVLAGHLGYKKFWWRGPNQTHWGNSPTTGWMAHAWEYDTGRRKAHWYMANVPDKDSDYGGGKRIPSSDRGAACKS